MNTPDYPVLAWIAAIVLACYLPRTVQRIRRRRAAVVRRQLRADLMREAELQQVAGQRDRYCALYHEAVKRNAALLEHIGDEPDASERTGRDPARPGIPLSRVPDVRQGDCSAVARSSPLPAQVEPLVTDTDGDSFVCYGCEASWSMDGTRGSWFERDAIACPSVIEWWNRPTLSAEHESIRHLTERCILPDDHGGQHRAEDSWLAWEDDDPRIVARERKVA